MYLADGIQLSEKYKSNQNVLVVGSPGTGKTRGHVIPSVISANGSVVVLDPKGETYDMTADLMRKRGYEVKSIDFDNPFQTDTYYNPLLHIRKGKHMGEDIIKVTNTLTKVQRSAYDPFWAHSAQLLGNSLIAYLCENCNEEDQTLRSVMKLLKGIDSSDLKESILEVMMKELKEEAPNSFAVEQYELFKTVGASEKTCSSIVITLICTFAECMSEGMCKLTEKNTIDFSELGKRRIALYIKSSDTDRSKDIVISMLFQQMFDELCHAADKNKNHCLDTHVHCFLDDFGTNLKIPDFDCYIAGMRSREISCSVILQSESQLKKMFQESWATIMASCHSYVFLGSNDLETCKNISERVNRPLDEILYKKYDDVFLFTQGELPQKCKRYDLKKDKHYHMLKEL